ncbi:SDR family oxidoreductase [Pseudonocardia nematodicida]|uniref:SDR family oxidoreductase n=1 Tax=Pseudonocardia nematodicida TaxID=1206997 RepID=A0ABV1K544_9PSEU
MSIRVALITGCGKPDGAGQGIARRLAAEGYAVVVTDRAAGGVPNARQVARNGTLTGDGLGALAADVAAAGGRALPVLGDIGEPGDTERMVAAAVDEFGRLDVLVNNAAAPQGADRADVEEVPLEVWQQLLHTNLTGTFLMCRAAVPVMRRQRYGRIVSISSMAGMSAAPRSAAYSASKAGVIGMTRALAMDVAGWGITVNAICPGMLATSRAVLDPTLDDDAAAEMVAARGARIAVGRAGGPSDVAAAVAYLASPDAGFVTAQTLVLDGGGLSAFPLPRPAEPDPELSGGRHG